MSFRWSSSGFLSLISFWLAHPFILSRDRCSFLISFFRESWHLLVRAPPGAQIDRAAHLQLLLLRGVCRCYELLVYAIERCYAFCDSFELLRGRQRPDTITLFICSCLINLRRQLSCGHSVCWSFVARLSLSLVWGCDWIASVGSIDMGVVNMAQRSDGSAQSKCPGSQLFECCWRGVCSVRRQVVVCSLRSG